MRGTADLCTATRGADLTRISPDLNLESLLWKRFCKVGGYVVGRKTEFLFRAIFGSRTVQRRLASVFYFYAHNPVGWDVTVSIDFSRIKVFLWWRLLRHNAVGVYYYDY